MTGSLGMFHSVEGTGLADRASLCRFVQGLPPGFAITKFGESEIAAELEAYSQEAFAQFAAHPSDYTHLRIKGFKLNHFTSPNGSRGDLLVQPTARSQSKSLEAADLAWEALIPDARGFAYQYSSYPAEPSDPRYGRPDSESLNRFGMVVYAEVRDPETGRSEPVGGLDVNLLGKLDLLPGLTYRAALGRETLAHFRLTPDELAAVCHEVTEGEAADGTPIWRVQVRPDPWDWEDSLARQRRLNRPDVFFDIGPMRERFVEPVVLADPGAFDSIDEEVRSWALEHFPEPATRRLRAAGTSG
ncbi:hypothetical protein FHY55_05575 [Oceanicola sp. D3]|uniref:hypothetical protein n=1 Tax=Oceanicola sp. D3 TaxID=2587163 RepID=UPI0011242981|nr:hypothetical protein [Oceanicola sp. D3]QDC08739.1 hypothetical protein FHY55_05575 [Oceanicola sp. D3]